MKPEELQTLQKAQPFVPFNIHFKDGTVSYIPYPRMLVLTTRWLECGIPKKPGSWIMWESTQHNYDEIDRFEFVQLNMAKTA